MKEIEATISSLVKTQFPEFYNTEGARFIDFVQQHYAWMESQNQAINRSRSLFDYRDIDKTSAAQSCRQLPRSFPNNQTP